MNFKLEIWEGNVEPPDAEEGVEERVYAVFDETAGAMVFATASIVDEAIAEAGYERHGEEFVNGLVHLYHRLGQEQSGAFYRLDYSLLKDRRWLHDVHVSTESTDSPTLH